MNSLEFMITKHPDVKYTKKNPDTGDIKVTSEVYDKLNDEILENILHQTIINTK